MCVSTGLNDAGTAAYMNNFSQIHVIFDCSAKVVSIANVSKHAVQYVLHWAALHAAFCKV